MPKRKICIAQFGAPHGVKGVVRLNTFTEQADTIFEYGPLTDEAGGQTFELMAKGQSRGQLLVQVNGMTDRDQAAALKGVRLYVDRDQLPALPENEEEYYIADLVGLAVRDETGGNIGDVLSVQNYGGGDLLEIRFADGGIDMVIFTKQQIPEVNLAEGYIVMKMPEIVEVSKK